MTYKLYCLPCLVLLLLLTSCFPGQRRVSTAPFSYEDLKHRRESQLFYPDADVLGHLSTDGTQMTLRGPIPPAYGTIFGVEHDVPYAEIEAFYDEHLKALGWESSRSSVSLSTTDAYVAGWRNGALVFRFAVHTKEKGDPTWAATYDLIYEVMIMQDWPADD